MKLDIRQRVLNFLLTLWYNSVIDSQTLILSLLQFLVIFCGTLHYEEFCQLNQSQVSWYLVNDIHMEEIDSVQKFIETQG